MMRSRIIGCAALLCLLSSDGPGQASSGGVVGVAQPRTAAQTRELENPVAATPDELRACWDCDRARQPLVAFLEMQIGMWPQWMVNKFVRDGNIGDVNPAFWSRNVRGRWEWDPNSFDINQLGHPAQGSMYFNGWRTNGYGFWASQAATLAGSFFWECCGERNLPSNNDLLTTWIGGAALGEVSRRLSDLWLDNTTTGRARLGREVAAFAVNPVRGIDRVVRGHAWKVGENPPDARPAWAQGVIGVGGLVLDSDREDGNEVLSGAKLATRFRYGRLEDAVGKPFDHFEVEAELTTIPDALIYLARARGSLGGRFLGPKNDSTFLLTSFARYDYVRSPAFELGQQTLTATIERRGRWTDDLRVTFESSARLVPISAIEDDFITPFGEDRDYDYAYGVGYGGGGIVTWRNRAMVRWHSQSDFLRVADGEARSHKIARHEGYLQYQLGDRYGLGVGVRFQSRETALPDDRGTATAKSPEVWVTLLRATPQWRY